MNNTFGDHREGCQCQNCQYLKSIAHSFKELLKLLDRNPVRAKLQLTAKGHSTDMPLTVSLGTPFTAAQQEFDQSGKLVPNVGPLTYSSSDPTIATVDPSTGQGTTVAAGTATISGSDAGDNLQSSDTVTVTDPAVSATMVLTAQPQSQVKKA